MKRLLFTLLLMTGVILSVTEDNKDPHHFNYILYLKSSYQSCTGTLIAPQWVITAAHCFLPDLQVILTGRARNFNFHNLIGEILPYEKIVVHPNFTVTSPKNDLMLIKLSVPLAFFSNSIFQLPTVNIKINKSTVCFIYIWLKDEESSGNPVGSLHSMKIQINTDSKCKILLGERFLEDMFCIGHIEGYRDECQVVTAAPATCDGELQGVVSWGTGCILTDHTVVFTNIYSYIPWIKNTVSTK